MDEKNQSFSPADFSALLASPQAQLLLARLQQMDSARLNQAVAQAMSGNTDAARQILSPMMEDETLQSLAKDVTDSYGGI